MYCTTLIFNITHHLAVDFQLLPQALFYGYSGPSSLVVFRHTKLLYFLFPKCYNTLKPFSLTGVHYSNELWEYLLTVKYPQLEISKSKKIRTLIDTPRNAGIFNFLLQMEGPLDFGKIKETYSSNLTEKRNKSGEFKYPKIKQKLITCWGHYAWVKDTR